MGDHDLMMDFEDDLLTLHEDVMEEDDDGVDEILRDYKGDEKSKLRHRLITEEVHDTEESTGVQKEAGMTVLHRVAVVGSVSILEALLDAAQSRNLLDIKRLVSGETPLHIASANGRTALVNYLASNGADVNAGDAVGRSAIHHVADSFDEHATTDIVNILAVRGAHLNAGDQKGITALHIAAKSGRYKTVLALLKRGADPTLVDMDGRTALHAAQSSQSPETTQFLIKYGACVDAKDAAGDTPLSRAVNNLVKVARTPKKLTKRSSSYLRGVRLQISDESFTAIMEECVGKCSIDLLLEASADVNSSNNSGLTVCHFTARQGNVQLMEVILKHGADLSAKCHLGRTPIFEIRTLEMFEYMSQQGAALSVIDHSGNTLLHVLSQSKNINSKIFHNIVKTLAKDMNARNADRVTSLHLACSSGDVGKVESLCALGADIDAIDSAGQNALHHALYSGHDAVAQCLVLRGIAVNLPDNSGYTPLHVSLRMKSATETIRIIADHAGDMNCRDVEGRLPANMAVSFGHFGALKVLLERSAIIEEESPTPKLPNDVILNSNDNSNNNTEFDKCYASEHKLVNGNEVHDTAVGPVTSAFHLAVQHDDLSVIQELMRQKLDVNRVDADGLTPLHLALRESKTKCAEQLLSSKKTDVNTISVGGFTPLHDCILHCDSPHVLNLMIDLGVIFDIKTPSGDTALHLGLKENRKMATELLVKSGAGLSVIDAAGDSACHLAVKLHNEKECEDYLMLLLIDSENNGEHTEERIHSCLQLTDREGRTVLHHVLVKGYLELFSRLVAAIGPRDIDRTVNVIDSTGRTALHYAADNGYLTACTALIQAGAALINVNRPPYQSVLSLAASSGHVSIVELLVKNNATIEVDHRNKDLDQNPLIVALQSGHDKVAEVLFNSGTSISKLCTSKGQSALHLSAASCSLATVRRVIEMEEDTNSVSSPAGYSCHHFLNLCDSQGQTALHMSIDNDNTDVLDLLVREGSDVNQCDALGNTPLHLSASRTVVSYVHADALITAGASIDLRNALGQTALHLAVQQAETDVLELLVANEADINLQDISGKTALMLAIECGKIEAAEILLGYDADVRCHDNGGQSALHKAVVVRDVKPSSTRQLIRQLIKRGARLIDRDENGKTPLDLASDDVTSLLSQLNLERP